MATFTGSVVKSNYEEFYNEVRNNPEGFVKRVFRRSAIGLEPTGTFQIGEHTFTLTLATNGKTRELCIERKFDNRKPWIQVRMRKLMDALFFRSSTSSMERALRKGSTVKTGLVSGMRMHADRIVEQLWPDIAAPNGDAGSGSSSRRGNAGSANRRAISERSLQTLMSLNPGEIDAWMRCPEGGPVGLEHIDRSKTRIEDDILVLSFKSGGDAIEFRLQARPDATREDSKRVQRDMERLLRIAKGQRDGCGYRNMAELMGRFMVATIEDEAPRLLEERVGAIVDHRVDDDARLLLACTVKRDGRLEPTRATRRAIARAVDDVMASCRASAAQRYQAVLNDVCRDKRDPVVSAVLDLRDKMIEKIQQDAKPFLAQRRLDAFVRKVVLQSGVNATTAQELHDSFAEGATLPEGVRLVHFKRKPGLLDWLAREAPREEVLVVALPQDQDGEALRFAPQRDMAKWAWKTIKLAKMPKNVETDAKALHQTVFDSSLGRFFRDEIGPLLKEGADALGSNLDFHGHEEERDAKTLLQLLTASLRIGNTTCGYLHRWAGEAQASDRAGTGSAAGVVLQKEDSEISRGVTQESVSPQQAAAYALRQALKHVLPTLANVTNRDCNKPVTVHTEGKFESVPQFGGTASREGGGQSPQWRPISQSQRQNPQPGPSPSSSSSTEPPSAPRPLRGQEKQQAEAKQRAEETQRAEAKQRAEETQRAEAKQRAEEMQRAEAKQRAEEMQRAQTNPAEQHPAQQNPAEQNPAQQNPAQPNPADQTPTEDKVPS